MKASPCNIQKIFWLKKKKEEKKKISEKNKTILFFFLFCSKQRFWIHIRCGSNEYPQPMLWSKNKKNVYPCIFQFNFISAVSEGIYYTDMFV